jgi:NAD(P)-dependent dehydrogenase (short-subunit alcohol dehydrogenase family)
MSNRLANKVAVVTGGTSGIGFATARRFVSEGAFVFFTGRRTDALAEAQKALGVNAIGVRGDVADLADLDHLYDTVSAMKGRIDILFANAGVGKLAPLGEITEEQFDVTFGTNVRGMLFTVQKALPLMSRGSSIVLNASTASTVGTPSFSVYCASKAAVRSFARNWILDLKGRDIRVNAVSPGVVPTPGYELLGLSAEQIEGFVNVQKDTIPMGRVGTVDEIARAVVFLASEESTFVDGIELFVDGGMAQI